VAPERATASTVSAGRGARVLLIDHLDSFVHTLANYLRQTGAEVVTLRAGFEPRLWDELDPDLVVLSPGPGSPSEFKLSQSIEQALSRQLPVFGVCLGLQGIVEHFGGELGVLDYPMHGKPSLIDAEPSPVFDGISSPFRAGRYHSLFAKPEKLPAALKVTARSQDGVIMAVEHVTLPIAAVQFHPESLMSLGGAVGLRLLDNAVAWLRAHPKARRRSTSLHLALGRHRRSPLARSRHPGHRRLPCPESSRSRGRRQRRRSVPPRSRCWRRSRSGNACYHRGRRSCWCAAPLR
jgi:anthranilate synthase/aminodeoxychorismate synthase-like glutamine amidotransferase